MTPLRAVKFPTGQTVPFTGSSRLFALLALSAYGDSIPTQDLNSNHVAAANQLAQHGLLLSEACQQLIEKLKGVCAAEPRPSNAHQCDTIGYILIDLMDDKKLVGGALREELSREWSGFSNEQEKKQALATIDRLQRLVPAGADELSLAVDHLLSSVPFRDIDGVYETRWATASDSIYQRNLALTKKICESVTF